MYTRVIISTIVTSYERQRFDALSLGLYETRHRHSVDELRHDVQTFPVSAIIISATRRQTNDAVRIGQLLREYPRLHAIALLTEVTQEVLHTVLSLGRCGIQHLIDLRQSDSWKELRHILLRAKPDNVHHAAMTALADDLAPDIRTTEAWAFFEALFSVPFTVRTVTELIRVMEVAPTTFMSRFYRLGLPRIKRYLSFARLTRAAYLLEDSRISVAHVADSLGYSSAQSFSRHVRHTLDITPTTFRRHYDANQMIHMFREQLVKPYVTQFSRFPPVPHGKR